jgi:hypothetical protein
MIRRAGVFFAVGALVLLKLFLIPGLSYGQAIPTATRSGGYIAVGGSIAGYTSPYTAHEVAGYSLFADVNVTRRWGIEGEARRLRFNTDQNMHSATYLVGPRISTTWPKYRPYAKVLVGTGQFNFPFGYAHGSYFTGALGGGLDVNVLHGRAFIRVIDFEYQGWKDFQTGSARPYGLSSGISIRVF